MNKTVRAFGPFTLIAIAVAFIAFIASMFLVVIGYNNSLNNKEESAKAAWSQVEASYQRRADFMAQAVPVVKEASLREGEILEQVIGERYKGDDPAKLSASESNLTSKFSAVLENYPQLKSQQGFIDLQNQIEGSENRINRARMVYIDTVTRYNKAVRNFPGSIFGREQMPLFESDEGAENAPKIDFGR